MKQHERITPLEKDFAKWYTDVVKQSELMTYGPVKGTIIFEPLGFSLWDNIKTILDSQFKKQGVNNVYFPLFMPKRFLEKEKDHIEGFAPEVATVTRVGDTELDEAIVVRPTSEVLFCNYFSDKINSYKDLPILYNQWANVVRWEKTTRPFLRTSEFLWQEGHTVHESALQARQFARKMIKMYRKFLQDYLAIPTLFGKKTPMERFAGAKTTYTVEALMKDGKALQSGTSHYLGQNFAHAFNIKFQNSKNKLEFVYQTSWGVSTRLIGALIMCHSDNYGLVLPPKVAPVEVVIMPIFADKHPLVMEKSQELFKSLKRRFRTKIDLTNKGPGYKAAANEIKGTPIRIEIGPRDIANDEVTIVRRDTLKKEKVNISEVRDRIKPLLTDIHNQMLAKATKHLEDNIVEVTNYDQFKAAIKDNKIVLAPFGCNSTHEEKIKIETQATTRCIPIGNASKPPVDAKCFYSNKKAKKMIYFAKAY